MVADADAMASRTATCCWFLFQEGGDDMVDEGGWRAKRASAMSSKGARRIADSPHSNQSVTHQAWLNALQSIDRHCNILRGQAEAALRVHKHTKKRLFTKA
jgi:hypothetical protein